jgi:hypothetical protein
MLTQRAGACVVGLVCCASPTPVHASVIYDLAGEYDGGTFGFTYTASEFVTPWLLVPATSLDECDPVELVCDWVQFSPWDISFTSHTPGVTTHQISIGGFPAGYLSTAGSYPGHFNSVLTVTPTSVAEPTLALLFAFGLAGVCARRWHR